MWGSFLHLIYMWPGGVRAMVCVLLWEGAREMGGGVGEGGGGGD